MTLFGTDGVRGLANGPLTADLALTLAQATAVVLGQGRIANARKAAGRRLTAVVARDPRISGHFLAAAVWRGLFGAREDVDFERLAEIVAYMRRQLKTLEEMSDEEVILEEWEFERNPGMESEAVARQSPRMNLAATNPPVATPSPSPHVRFVPSQKAFP